MNQFANQINQIRQSNQAGIDRTFSDINQGVANLQQIQTNKLKFVGNKLEMVNAIADELGKITGEYVEEERDNILKEIKGSIMSETKIGNIKLGQSIDLNKLNSFNDKISRLGRLAENSRVIDQLYKSAEERVSTDPLINEADRSKVKNRILQTIADKETLETLSIEDATSTIDSIIRSGSDDVQVIRSYMGKVGDKEYEYTDASKRQVKYKLPEILELGANNMPQFSNQGEQRVRQAMERAVADGYNIDLQTAPERYFNTLNTSVGIKEQSNVDRLREQNLMQQMSGSGKEEIKPIVIDVLSNYLMGSDKFTTGGDSDTLDGILRSNGIYVIKSGRNIKVVNRKDYNKFNDLNKNPQKSDLMFNRLGGDSFSLDDKKDIITMRSMLLNRIESGDLKELESDPKIREFFVNAHKNMRQRVLDKSNIKQSIKGF